MKTLTLTHPLVLGKTTVNELKFRDYATAEDMLAFDQRGPNQQTINLIASLTGTDEALIKKLHVADYRAADTIASGLIHTEDAEKNVLES